MSDDTKQTGLAYVTATSAMQAIARKLQTMTNEEVPAAMDFFTQLKKMSDGVRDNIKDRLLLYMNVNGKQVTEKGTLETVVGGYLVRTVPVKTGVDSKKLEKLLRARGIDVVAGMDPVTTWKANADKVQRMVGAGLLSESDVRALQYDTEYRVEVKRQDTSTTEVTIEAEAQQ